MQTYCGYIALVGRPNVGKSTLLNCLLKQKLSITSRKPQTTRHRILGVSTEDAYQLVYVDTPGFQAQTKKTMNQLMNQTVMSVLHDVDSVVFVVEALQWRDEDEAVLTQLKALSIPCVLVVNKVDMVADKARLLPWIEELSQRHTFETIIPLSAKSGSQVDVLQETLKHLLPESPHFFGDDQLTDRPTPFLCAELLREKIFRLTGQELPYSTTVEIESYEDEGKLVRINALILIDKASHKHIIIGEKGSKLKDIGTQARQDMERLLGKKVFLRCWCKVKSGWTNDERYLRQSGM